MAENFHYGKSVGLEVPKVEVRYENITLTANVNVGSRALPTLVNSVRDVIEVNHSILQLILLYYSFNGGVRANFLTPLTNFVDTSTCHEQ